MRRFPKHPEKESSRDPSCVDLQNQRNVVHSKHPPPAVSVTRHVQKVKYATKQLENVLLPVAKKRPESPGKIQEIAKSSSGNQKMALIYWKF
ncbi:hypothetical protein PCASD_04523 [Puccinia coronata f. sp. avenae]|uniref:Uncharacterized protein n=1 Tax=Puccinia coronata f. sp. avenae TaxID=200324 RepID=A0A2N5V2X7_9BASI|nr:hypothetical protein PCASD_15131 [Puccinia coronata f. sp. avenae]PLW44368.1 hypothetical protein PCASD_04523 [Puccinia coronata f. sp. avenae]